MKQVVPGFYRGPRPKDPEIFRDNDIEVVVNLESGFRDVTHKDSYEMFDFYGNGIIKVDIPMSNFWPPTAQEIVLAFRAITKAKYDGKKLYLHCYSGVDRTGYVVAVYRMQQCGWTFEKAYKEFKTEGRHPWFFWWKNALKKWSLDGYER